MNIETQKTFWWMLLLFFSGPCLVAAYGCLYAAITPGAFMHGEPCFCILVNGSFVMLALQKLRRCHRESPEHWTGKWQLSLADLLGIVFVFGIAMAICRAVFAENFLTAGMPISMGIGVAYTFALLFVSRMGNENMSPKWLSAFGFLMAAAFMCGAGIFVECGSFLWVSGYPGE